MADAIETENHAAHLTVTEARQGRRGRHIAWVLGVSTALAVAGLGAVYLTETRRPTAPGGQTSASERRTSQAFNAPTPPPPSR
jgi:hypothetical protein